ncbi:MAG: hypothetical protein U0V70_22340, partial [Terriglobia bacterium]
LFLTEATHATPRSYAISLCIDAYGLPRVLSKEKWAEAFSIYEKLNAKYGEANVLAAAGRVKEAPLDSEGRLKGDPQYNRQTYWLDTLLKNPKAELPGAVPHFRASSYDPRWLGKTVEVRGTVSRVDMDQSGSPKYATIRFKEAATGNITGFSPHADMLREMYGQDFSGLVGKVVEVYGEVNPWRGGGGVRIIDRDQVKVLDLSALGPDFKDSKPDWLTAAKPAETQADNPQYLAWKKFPPGTTVTLVDRVLSEYEPGSNTYTRSKTGRTTLRLDLIDDKQAVLTVKSTVYQMNGRTSSSEQQINYQAKQPPGQSGAAKPNESGQETLEINGKKIATHWEVTYGILPGTFAQPDRNSFVKTWSSDDVPGGLVLKNNQEYREITGKPYRSITQTILETVENVEPVIGPAPKQASAGAPAAPSSPAPTSTTGNQPRAQTPTSTPTPTPTTQAESKTAPATQAPAPPAQPAPPPKPKRGFGFPIPIPVPKGMPPDVAAQMGPANEFKALMARVSPARSQLAQVQREKAASGTELPQDVRNARDRLDAELNAVSAAMLAGDNALFKKNLHTAEATLIVIEQFLAK